MLEKISRLKGVRTLKRDEQSVIQGGVDYLCWNDKGNIYEHVSSDISTYDPSTGQGIHCVPYTVVGG